ncbi:S8/S53 family peptidase [Actinomycetes bacterium KLBMP 9759]
MKNDAAGVRAFDSTLTDMRPEAKRAEERKRVKEQVGSWVRLQRDDAHRKTTSEQFAGRRVGRRDLVQFDAVDNKGADTFVVSGQFLITGKNYGALGEGQLALIEELGLVAAPVPGLGKAVYSLDATPESIPGIRNRTASVAGRLIAARIPVRHSYVTPLGMVRKAQGGPENSSWTQQKPAVAVSGPKVAVIDTGVSAEQRADGWLNGLVRNDNVDLLDVIPQPTDNRLDLGAGHGSFVTGVVQQVAPGADLRVYQALDTDGAAAETAVAAAIVTAVQDGAKILNLSFGTDTLEADPPLSLRVAIEQAIAIDDGVLIVCAAGNTGDTRQVWPASFHTEFPENVVSVAALGIDETTGAVTGAGWSTHGSVTCSTLGEGVVSTYVIGTESHAADQEGPDTFGPASWATWSGTSFAAPQVVGAVTKVLQDPQHSGKTPREALGVVLQNATTIAGYGKAVVILPA